MADARVRPCAARAADWAIDAVFFYFHWSSEATLERPQDNACLRVAVAALLPATARSTQLAATVLEVDCWLSLRFDRLNWVVASQIASDWFVEILLQLVILDGSSVSARWCKSTTVH